jgi:adenylylsulfate kinase
MVIWLTGQPGSGKTSICKEILTDRPGFFHIDGDHLRDLFDNKDYSEQGRRKNIELGQQIAHYLHNEGLNVLVSLVSPYKDQRDKFKKKLGNNLIEVYVHTSEIRGRENFFVKDYDPPTEDFIDLDTTNITVYECVNKIFDHLEKEKKDL